MTGKLLKVLAGVGAILLISLAMSAPVFAGGKDKAGDGSGYTEDNDSNDNGTMNNVPDDGDNAHPSGKDKSVEHGKSGNQGKSGSDPDGDSNGGADKPNGPGGTDKADQDGNNGCGNDDDFEDDNNGNCGPKDKTKTKPCVPHGKSEGKGKAHVKGNSKHDCVEGSSSTKDDDEVEGDTLTDDCPEDDAMAAGDSDGCGDDDAEVDDDVLGGIIGGGPDAEDDEVLGDTLTNDEAAAAADREAGASLPFTGAAILTIVALGVGLLATGALVMHRRKAHI